MHEHAPQQPHTPPTWGIIALFPLGKLVATPAALQAFERTGEHIATYVERHKHADWGDMDDHDKAVNASALAHGGRLFSRYYLPDKTCVYIITEADRSSTCVLLPADY